MERSEQDGLPTDLPCLGQGEKFSFSCGPEQPCFNRCCSQLSLPLTPYDVTRLAHGAGLPESELLKTFTGMSKEPRTGLPMFHLRMIESPDAPCPFVTPAGCAVYEDRPGACRAYPLGRGARLERGGVAKRFFIVREEHCQGFGCGPERTPEQWLTDQGAGEYNEFNDLFMRLMSLIAATGAPIPDKLGGAALLCLWQMDRFRDFLLQMGALDQFQISDAEKEKMLEPSPAGSIRRLRFGLKWLELLLFGEAQGLERKRKQASAKVP